MKGREVTIPKIQSFNFNLNKRPVTRTEFRRIREHVTRTIKTVIRTEFFVPHPNLPMM